LRPKILAKNAAAAALSRAGTMVWLSVMVIGASSLSRAQSFQTESIAALGIC
jgi:hypothetical protein